MAFSFWLFTVVVLLYGWALSETVPLTVEVREGMCTAKLGERSSTIPCPDLDKGEVGVYLTSSSTVEKLLYRPLDLLVPYAEWDEVTMIAGGSGIDQYEGREIKSGAVVIWPVPEVGSYTIAARVRRPDGEYAGILLTEPGRKDGRLFMVDTENRQGTWWQWQDNRPVAAIAGVPYQKPLLAQAQSLVRQVLATFFGALTIIVSVAIIQCVNKSTFQQGSKSAKQLVIHQRVGNPKSPHVALLIVLAIFGVSLWIAVDRLERIPHVQDSITYLFQAQTLARGALWAPEPPMPDAFVQEFLTVWEGKWFGQYPPGYPAVLAAGVLAGAPWLVNPLLVTLTTALLIKLGALLFRKSVGLLVGGLAFLSPFFLFLSGSLMVHSAELFWVVLGMVGWTLALRAPYRVRWALLAGAALGMLVLTRQITAIAIGGSFIVMMFVVEVWTQHRAHRNTFLQEKWQRLGWQVAGMLVAILPFLLLLLGYQAALMGSPWRDPRLLARPFDQPGFGTYFGESENSFELLHLPEGTAVVWYTDPNQPPRGHSIARGLYNTEENLEELARNLFGWYPLVALAYCWIPFLLGKPHKYDWVLLAVLLAIVGMYVAYWTTGIMYGPRYYYASLPALFLLTGRGLQILGKWFGARATILVFTVLLVLALIFYWPDAVASLREYNYISNEERVLVEEQIQEPALVFVPVEDWWDYGRFFSGNTPWLDSQIIYARDLGQEQNNCLQLAFSERTSYLWQPQTESVITLPTGNKDCRLDDERD